MKRLLLGLTALSCLAAGAKADLGLTAIMRTHRMSALEAAAVVVIADALKLDADFIISTGRGSGVSPVVYGPALIYSQRTHQPFPEVWAKRKRGWGEIAHSIGMHPGTFNKLRRQGYSVDQIIWMDCLNDKYRIPYSDYGTWRKGGYSDGRILELVARNNGNRSKIKSAVSKGKGKSSTSHGNSGKAKGPSMHGKGKGGPPSGKGKDHGGPPSHAGGGGNGKGHGGGPPAHAGGKGKGRG